MLYRISKQKTKKNKGASRYKLDIIISPTFVIPPYKTQQENLQSQVFDETLNSGNLMISRSNMYLFRNMVYLYLNVTKEISLGVQFRNINVKWSFFLFHSLPFIQIY